MTRLAASLGKITIGLLAICGASCSVLEDRRPCPCYLDVDYTEILTSKPLDGKPGKVDVVAYLPTREYPSAFTLSDCPDINENAVERGQATVVGIVHNRPLETFLKTGARTVWEPGNQIDSVFVHSSTVDCSGEEAYCLLHPHKRFHTIHFSDGRGGEVLRTWNMVVRGTTCGFDAVDFSTIDGEYLYTIQEYDADGGVSVRVPQQREDDLLLEFWSKEDYRKVFSFPVGRYMAATGYDRRAADLCDFDIRIDFRENLAYVRVADWVDEWIFSIYE